jgi:hypothetical protein
MEEVALKLDFMRIDGSGGGEMGEMRRVWATTRDRGAGVAAFDEPAARDAIADVVPEEINWPTVCTGHARGRQGQLGFSVPAASLEK